MLNQAPRFEVYEEVGLLLHALLTLVLNGGEWWASRSGSFTTGERTPDTHWTGDLVSPRAGLDVVAKRRNPFIAPRPNTYSGKDRKHKYI
jgi:hypothetical protein